MHSLKPVLKTCTGSTGTSSTGTGCHKTCTEKPVLAPYIYIGASTGTGLAGNSLAARAKGSINDLRQKYRHGETLAASHHGSGNGLQIGGTFDR